MTRDWILNVLADLPMWYWPIFLWDCAVMRGVLDELFGQGAGMITFGVTPWGRIMIVEQFDHDTPDPADWTVHAPYAPWEKLAPGAGIEALLAQLCGFGAGALWCTENVPLVHAHCTAPAPFLDSG